jgi:hypothetical protein
MANSVILHSVELHRGMPLTQKCASAVCAVMPLLTAPLLGVPAVLPGLHPADQPLPGLALLPAAADALAGVPSGSGLPLLLAPAALMLP